jgi:predicted HNH restriction endonuclease
MPTQRSDTAKMLARRWKLSVKHALYRKTGDWYHQLGEFPGALLDENGYVIFLTEEEYRNCPQLRIRQDVAVRDGIKNIPGYTLAPDSLSVEAQKESGQVTEIVEGNHVDVVQTRIERDAHARAACLEAHGYACSVCDLEFAKRYGEVGVGFIHVHHLRPLSEGAREVDPIQDLRPICPNCHAMAHRRTPPFTIEELRAMLIDGNA